MSYKNQNERTMCTAADQDHRSIANMIEVMIREYCERVGITIQEARSQVPDNKKNSK